MTPQEHYEEAEVLLREAEIARIKSNSSESARDGNAELWAAEAKILARLALVHAQLACIPFAPAEETQ